MDLLHPNNRFLQRPRWPPQTAPAPRLEAPRQVAPAHDLTWHPRPQGRRITAGVRRAKAAGKRWGGRKEGDRYKLTDEKLEAVRELLAAGKKKAAIARQLGISRNSVYRAIEAIGKG